MQETFSWNTSAFDDEHAPFIHRALSRWAVPGYVHRHLPSPYNYKINIKPSSAEAFLEGMAKCVDDGSYYYAHSLDVGPAEAKLKEREVKYGVWVNDNIVVNVGVRIWPDGGEVAPFLMLHVYYKNDLAGERAFAKVNQYILDNVSLSREDNTTGVVYMMMTDGGNFTFKALPSVIDTPLERGNYAPSVIDLYSKVVADLSSTTPAGRIAIFDGPPGSGKTYMVRGLLTECSNTAFVFVSPDQLISMAGPSFLAQLIQFHNNIKKSITFLVEDADEIIANRNNGNMSHVAGVLNMGDGILGQMLDIRLIFTTNAKGTDLDPAIVRPGRMSAHIHVGKLEPQQCQDIYKRLTGKEVEFAGHKTLAEVYQEALNTGWVPSPAATKTTKRIGFSNDYD